MQTHHLKIWPEYFREVLLGIKKVEIRKDDRNYQERDLLVLNEWNPKTQKFTGGTVIRKIDHIMRDLPGLEEGYVLIQMIKAL